MVTAVDVARSMISDPALGFALVCVSVALGWYLVGQLEHRIERAYRRREVRRLLEAEHARLDARRAADRQSQTMALRAHGARHVPAVRPGAGVPRVPHVRRGDAGLERAAHLPSGHAVQAALEVRKRAVLWAEGAPVSELAIDRSADGVTCDRCGGLSSVAHGPHGDDAA